MKVKPPGKVALIGKASRSADFRERQIGFQNQSSRPLHSALFDKTDRRHPNGVLEQADKMKAAHIYERCQFSEIDGAIEIVVDEINQPREFRSTEGRGMTLLVRAH